MKNISIILVEPMDGANIGSVCRAMKTMNLTSLIIVGNKNNYDENRVRTTSLSAFDLYENARFVESLEKIISEFNYLVASTRRRGKKRKNFSFNPKQLCDHINYNNFENIAIVFGRENDGLTDKEVSYCNSVVTIETSSLFPSLNLSQAVQIICYNLFIYLENQEYNYAPIKVNEVDELSNNIINSLDILNCFKNREKIETQVLLKDILSRSFLSEFEKNRLEKLFNKISNIYLYKKD